MNLFEKIDDILEQEDNILPKKELEKIDFTFDEKMFSKMADFIISLDPDALTDSQVETVIDLIADLEIEDEEEDIQEIKNPKLARRTPASKNQYSKKWYRRNRTEIKRRKAKFKRSSEGRKRQKARERLERQGRTATGRRKVRYHVRQPSDRNDRAENRTTDRRGRDEYNRQD